MRTAAALALALAVCVTYTSASALVSRSDESRASASIWYDAIGKDGLSEFCGAMPPALDTAAFKEFEAAWGVAFASTGGSAAKGCGQQTARQVFDKIKAGMVKAFSPAKDYSDFDKLAKDCARELSSASTGGAPKNGFGLWSGGFKCSEIAGLFGTTVMEATQLGSILTKVFAYPHTRMDLAPAWHSCCGKMWNKLSVQFVDQMTHRCTVFFRYAGHDSVLYTQELPHLQTLLDGKKVEEVVFEVVQPESAGICGVRQNMRRVVTAAKREDLLVVLDEVAKKANDEMKDSVALKSLRAPPRPARAIRHRNRPTAAAADPKANLARVQRLVKKLQRHH